MTEKTLTAAPVDRLVRTFATCSHPDHVAETRCADRAVACSANCACCLDEPLRPVVAAVFGGVSAMSPALFRVAIADIARQCGCPVDESLYAAVVAMLAALPCPMD